MFIAIGGPQAHVTLSMTDTLFQQPARLALGDANSRNKFAVSGHDFSRAAGVSTFQPSPLGRGWRG